MTDAERVDSLAGAVALLLLGCVITLVDLESEWTRWDEIVVGLALAWLAWATYAIIRLLWSLR